jgi:hypothetical protein
MKLARHGLDADADERRQRGGLQAGGDLERGGARVAVFFGVRPRAVAVLEVDAEVFDRLAPQLLQHPGAHRRGERGIARREANRRSEGRGCRCQLFESPDGFGAGEPAGIPRERLARTDERVHRLPARGIARVQAGEPLIRCL